MTFLKRLLGFPSALDSYDYSRGTCVETRLNEIFPTNLKIESKIEKKVL